MSNQIYDKQAAGPPGPPPVQPSIPGPGYPPPGYNTYNNPGNYGQPPISGPYQPPQSYTPGYQPYYPYSLEARSEVVGFWPRFVAMLINGFIIGIPSGIFYSIFTLAMFGPFINSWNTWGAGNYPFSWGSSIIFWGLYAWLCYRFLNGNTLGKSVMGIKLVNPDGSKPSLQTFLLHYTVGYFINGLVLGLGYLWVLFDPYKQTWGQKLFKDSTVRGTW